LNVSALAFNQRAMRKAEKASKDVLDVRLAKLRRDIEAGVLDRIRQNPGEFGLVPLDVLFPEPMGGRATA
jgi:hypothetical protein